MSTDELFVSRARVARSLSLSLFLHPVFTQGLRRREGPMRGKGGGGRGRPDGFASCVLHTQPLNNGPSYSIIRCNPSVAERSRSRARRACGINLVLPRSICGKKNRARGIIVRENQ